MRFRLPPYVQGFTDRYGKPRYYFRREGLPRVPLPGLPWSTEFMEAHSAAMIGVGVDRALVGIERAMPGTMNALAMSYLNSGAFKVLAPMTRSTYRNAIEAIIAKHGEKRVKLLETRHVIAMVDAKAATPSAANHMLRMMRILMRFAVSWNWRKTDPTVGVKQLKEREGGFVPWSESDIAAFEATHPIGTRARLAHDLLLYTAQRRGDVVRMGRQHVRNEVLAIKQQKTGVVVEIPIVPNLRATLDGTQTNNLTFITTEQGKPFTSAGFGNWFREMCDQAGLAKHLAAHGLRKAASRRLAEAGCTAHEIMSITGHKTLREVSRYTASVDRRSMALSATNKLKTATSIVKP